MKLLILHYHLNRGGVTRVIENHCRALAAQPRQAWPEQVVIAFGGRATAWDSMLAAKLPFPTQCVAVAELEYDQLRPALSAELTPPLKALLSDYGFRQDDSVVMVHNHSLGKNTALPVALQQLAREGWPLLLQIHDFAEDLRPLNYQRMLARMGSPEQLHRQLYPQASHVHYAVLNGRDCDILARAGVSADRLHQLPNPVAIDPVGPSLDAEQARHDVLTLLEVPASRRYLLYPVRGIRRKNLGEFLLWSAVVDGVACGTTLAPLNEDELPAYRRWVQLANELKLPVWFDVGNRFGLSLAQNYAAADAVITTSVAEGFGLVYLEAYLAGRPLVGRSLPGITDDFVAAGVQFPWLAEQFLIPGDWVDRERLKRAQAAQVLAIREAFGMPAGDAGQVQQAIEAKFSGDEIDFGRLDSKHQIAVLRHIRQDAHACRTIRDLNPITAPIQAGHFAAMVGDLRRNLDVIRGAYALEVIGARFGRLLQRVVGSPRGEVAECPEIAESILDQFVQPDHLFPIRLE